MGLFQPETKTTGTTTQTGTTITSPYGPTGSLWSTLFKNAGSMFGKGGLNPYTPMNYLQKQGMTQQLSDARRGQGYLDSALKGTYGFAHGAGDVSSQAQTDLAGQAMGPSYAEQNLAGVANGSQIGGNDPNYERLRQRALENAATEAGMTASGMGRTGSDFHQTAVARQVGDTAAGMDMQRLQEQEARQMEANQQMDAARQAGLGLGLNAENSATAIQTGNEDRRFGANQAIPGMYDATLQPGKTIQGIGDTIQADKLAKLGGGGQNLASLLQILSGGNPFGTVTNNSTSTDGSTNTGQDNTLGGILGLGLGGASLLKTLQGLI